METLPVNTSTRRLACLGGNFWVGLPALHYLNRCVFCFRLVDTVLSWTNTTEFEDFFKRKSWISCCKCDLKKVLIISPHPLYHEHTMYIYMTRFTRKGSLFSHFSVTILIAFPFTYIARLPSHFIHRNKAIQELF